MAFYNTGFPATYQPVYQFQQPAPQAQTQQTGLNWIQGEQAAKSYLVAPNNTVVLFDSESQTIYLKSADASGMPSLKVLDYTIRDSNKTAPLTQSGASDGSLSNFATKDEIRVVTDQITALRERIDNLTKREKGEDDK